MRKYHKDGTSPRTPNTVFVFGSNLAGHHGAGAAREAYNNYGAIMGAGVGHMLHPSGATCYAIPTKDKNIETLPISEITKYVDGFIQFAKRLEVLRPEMNIFVTRIGCQLAGYDNEDIAPLFKNAPQNCSFAEEWMSYLED
jgi:hypothetical protein